MDILDYAGISAYCGEHIHLLEIRHAYCAALEKAMLDAGLDHGETVARLYAAEIPTPT